MGTPQQHQQHQQQKKPFLVRLDTKNQEILRQGAMGRGCSKNAFLNALIREFGAAMGEIERSALDRYKSNSKSKEEL